ncbi:helix-turn-helix domain-containing protein [Halalkalirubrum salinum]|uniref:helix-turn-helix domain-containing protein n=1 Tax=Halalkalirubrum salinum TaxID=2563889 RepID=UPI0010FB10E5|nr:helix-turn-helix domain-containing protein [Halalkalirubrum salinum]
MTLREVTLQIRHHDAPESEVSAKYPDVTLRSMSSLTGAADERRRIIEFTGPEESIQGFLMDFEREAPIIAVEPITAVDRSTVLAMLTFDSRKWDSISELLADLGVHYRSGTVICGGWERWSLFLTSDDSMQEVIETIEADENTVRLVRTVELENTEATRQLEVSKIINSLTQRQLDVLSTSIRLNYYQPNRETTIAEVGNRLDLSPTTTWEHLARAEKKLWMNWESILTVTYLPSRRLTNDRIER